MYVYFGGYCGSGQIVLYDSLLANNWIGLANNLLKHNLLAG